MQYKALCKEVEQRLHRQLKTRGDFEYLSEQIQNKTNESLSSNTLMRLWGYRPSVSTRQSTLDILARFIGYNDYTEFQIEKERETEEPVAKNDENINETQLEPNAPRPRKRWLWGLVAMLAIIMVIGGFYLLKVQAEPQEPVYVTSLEQLSNERQYYIHTRDKKRGTLGVGSHQLATTFDAARFYRCDTASTFALIQFEGSHYLYSVQRHRFLNVLHAETDDPLRREYAEKNWCAIDLRTEEGYLVFDYWADSSNGKVFTLNVNSGNGLIITDWGTMNGVYDDGNLFMLEDAGPFDPSEALGMLERSRSLNP